MTDLPQSHGLLEIQKSGSYLVADQGQMKKKNIKNLNKSSDEDFEKFFTETDFSKSDIKPVLIKSSERKGGRPKIGRKLSIILPEELIKRLEKAGESRGVGYQTMIRMICSENIDDYLRPHR